MAFHHRWKRINFDAHSAIGIWTLFIVSWWGITAIYFLLPERMSAVVNVVSPLVGMKEPHAPEPPPGQTVARLEDILARQQTISPGYLSGIALPEKTGGNVTLYVDRLSPGDFSHRDIDTFDGHTGELLTVWHYGENHSLGDWFLWLMYPLQLTLWGLPVKILWALLGFSLAVLSVTGLLMYWNRYLGTPMARPALVRGDRPHSFHVISTRARNRAKARNCVRFKKARNTAERWPSG